MILKCKKVKLSVSSRKPEVMLRSKTFLASTTSDKLGCVKVTELQSDLNTVHNAQDSSIDVSFESYHVHDIYIYIWYNIESYHIEPCRTISYPVISKHHITSVSYILLFYK